MNPKTAFAIAFATAVLPVSASVADEHATVVLAVVGAPQPSTVIGDARHCPTKVAPLAKVGGDKVEYPLAAREPTSITLTALRGGIICGGSLYIVPEAGLGYAVRLTPGTPCAAQLFRIDPHAQPPVQLLQTDNHPELNEVICAAQQGSAGASRLSVGRNARAKNVHVEIGTGGSCGKFAGVSQSESGVELASGVKQWIQLQFRSAGKPHEYNGGIAITHNSCDVNFAFTPIAGAAYLIDSGANQAHCEARLLRADVDGTIAVAPVEPVSDSNCKPAN